MMSRNYAGSKGLVRHCRFGDDVGIRKKVALCRRFRCDGLSPEGPAAPGLRSPAGPYGGDPRQPNLARLSESGHRAGYDGAGFASKKDSKVHAAVDTLGRLLALRVTLATEQDHA